MSGWGSRDFSVMLSGTEKKIQVAISIFILK